MNLYKKRFLISLAVTLMAMVCSTVTYRYIESVCSHGFLGIGSDCPNTFGFRLVGDVEFFSTIIFWLFIPVSLLFLVQWIRHVRSSRSGK